MMEKFAQAGEGCTPTSFHYIHHQVQRIAPQSTHRVAISDFWRSSHYDGKISPGLWEWGCTPTPFQPVTITYKVVVYAPAKNSKTDWKMLSLILRRIFCWVWTKNILGSFSYHLIAFLTSMIRPLWEHWADGSDPDVHAERSRQKLMCVHQFLHAH